jgi:hypothetical protein
MIQTQIRIGEVECKQEAGVKAIMYRTFGSR